MGLGKYIFNGVLGWVLGGPLGVVIGLALAMFSDGARSDARRLGDGGYVGKGRSRSQRNDFKVVLLVMLAAVMKSDGHVQKSELEVVKGFLRRTFGKDGALEALQLLKGILKQDFDVDAIAEQARENLNYSQCLALVDLLFRVAYSDGVVTSDEEGCIARIARGLRVSQVDFDSLKAMFVGRDEGVGWAYKVLEIDEKVDDEEVKRAYRRMAMKYHPDKVATLGEEIKQQAEEKFKEIQRAYEAVKRSRGM